MAYKRSGDFKIRVKDVFGKEVEYPPLVESVEENVLPNQGVDNNNDELEDFPHERCFLHILNKYITVDDIVGNTMVSNHHLIYFNLNDAICLYS